MRKREKAVSRSFTRCFQIILSGPNYDVASGPLTKLWSSCSRKSVLLTGSSRKTTFLKVVPCLVRVPGLVDDRHLSCFSSAAAADDLRSVCLWIMSNHRDKEDNLQSRQHKEVLETSKHQRVHKSLRWDDSAVAGWSAWCISQNSFILDWGEYQRHYGTLTATG